MKTIKLTADFGTVSATQEIDVTIDLASQTIKMGFDNKPRYIYNLTEELEVQSINGTKAVIKSLPSKTMLTNPKAKAKEWVIENKSFITL